MDTKAVGELNPVTLAYIGDAVFSLYVRSRVVHEADYKADEATGKANSCVKATAQSAMLERIMPMLTESEADVVRRGRNCHTPQKAKNAGLMDYKRATALEALLGWLYLRKEYPRLKEICDECVKDFFRGD